MSGNNRECNEGRLRTGQNGASRFVDSGRASRHGISGRNTERPGLDNAINAPCEGDVFCVTKLDRLCRSAKGLHETRATGG
nr:recombinase family protein [Rhodococcus qingshengii]